MANIYIEILQSKGAAIDMVFHL